MGLHHGERAGKLELYDKLIPANHKIRFYDTAGNVATDLRYFSGFCTIHLIDGDGDSVGWVKLMQLPECCGALFVCDLTVYGSYRVQGLGTALMRIVIRLAEVMGYNSITGIIPAEGYDNARRIFEKQGFLVGHKVLNARTGNTLEWWHKDLGMDYNYYTPGIYRDDRVATTPSRNIEEYKK